MAERYVEVGGTRLFLDLRGNPADPPLLYLHGGPGMSCHDFMMWQGELLSRSCYLIGLDQRGVLRSDPLPEPLTDDVLVDDCEAIREALDIPQWTVLGHSFGGRIALRYAVRHPDRIRTMIVENPCWDWDDTERQRLPAAAALFDSLGEKASADRCRELAGVSKRIDDWREAVNLIASLGEHYDDLYFHQQWARDAFRNRDTGAFPEELLSRAEAHSEQALELALEPVLDLLDELTVPAVMIKGRHDLIAGHAQVEAFRRRGGAVHEFAESGHFVQLEEAAAYADLVTALTRG